MDFNELQKLDDKYILNSYKRYPLQIVSGAGVYAFDEKGKKYLDFLGGIAVNALGYGHPAILNVLKSQSERLIHISNLFYSDIPVLLAQKLCKISGMNKVFFCNSGAEANELAIKLAHAYGNASGKSNNEIVSMKKSFHGRTIAALSITKDSDYGNKFAPLLNNVVFVDFNSSDDLKASVNRNTAAIFIEPIQGEGGIHGADADFLVLARNLADEYGALLVFDQVQVGLGRTGTYFAHEFCGIQPDIITLAKPLGAGLPLGAVLMTDKAASVIQYGDHGSTFGANILVTSVALEFLNILESENLLDNVNTVGQYFVDSLNTLKTEFSFIKEVRGKGLIIGIELDRPAGEIVLELIKAGLICNCTSETVIRFLPPYIITKAHVDEAVSLLDKVFQTVN